jgi:hypothetical protein
MRGVALELPDGLTKFSPERWPSLASETGIRLTKARVDEIRFSLYNMPKL